MWTAVTAWKNFTTSYTVSRQPPSRLLNHQLSRVTIKTLTIAAINYCANLKGKIPIYNHTPQAGAHCKKWQSITLFFITDRWCTRQRISCCRYFWFFFLWFFSLFFAIFTFGHCMSFQGAVVRCWISIQANSPVIYILQDLPPNWRTHLLMSRA